MTIKEGQVKLSELEENIALQQKLLDDGARKLRELNDLYTIEDRGYKELVMKKRRLVDEVDALMKAANLYSNF